MSFFATGSAQRMNNGNPTWSSFNSGMIGIGTRYFSRSHRTFLGWRLINGIVFIDEKHMNVNQLQYIKAIYEGHVLSFVISNQVLKHLQIQ